MYAIVGLCISGSHSRSFLAMWCFFVAIEFDDSIAFHCGHGMLCMQSMAASGDVC